MKALLLLALVIILPLPALADVESRVGRLERTLELLQRKMLSSGASSPLPNNTPTPLASPNTGNSASYELRLSTLEEQIRDLRGLIERVEYRQQRQEVEIQKMAEDMEFRFQQITPAGVAPEITADASVTPEGAERPAAVFEPATNAAKDAAASQNAGGFASPRAHYDHAFKLLGSGEYANAADSFTAFIRNYPKDALIGNAHYWLGETYYVRSDHVRAAEQFRLGFEALPKGPKANDNLLKLAMSLSQIQKEKEACVVLKQLTKPSDKVSETIRRRANAESERIACK